MRERKDADVLALEALAWVLAEPDLAAAWMEASGLDPVSLRARAGETEVLAAVLDFLLSSDALVTGFASAAGIAPEAVARARRALPGGEWA